MAGVVLWLRQLVDVRRGEWLSLGRVFAALLLLITAHTTLETARDALILTKLPARALGIVYVAVAVCALPAVWLASRNAVRFGSRRALSGGLVTATAALLVALFAVPMNRATAVAVYVTSSLIGAALVPLYWTLLASVFNVAQARRLLGIVGAAGVVGGVTGSVGAAALLTVVDTKALLLVACGVLLATAVVLLRVPAGDYAALPQAAAVLPSRRNAEDLRREPFLRRIALLVALSTVAALFLDYFFQWTVARTVPHDEISAVRFALLLRRAQRFWLLAAQIFVTGVLVRRIGVATTMVVTPLLLLLGGVGTLAAAGGLTAVLALKAIDGTLHNSVHRVTMELVYLPVPPVARARVKPFIDGALVRTTQAGAGLLLLGLGGANFLSSLAARRGRYGDERGVGSSRLYCQRPISGAASPRRDGRPCYSARLGPERPGECRDARRAACRSGPTGRPRCHEHAAAPKAWALDPRADPAARGRGRARTRPRHFRRLRATGLDLAGAPSARGPPGRGPHGGGPCAGKARTTRMLPGLALDSDPRLRAYALLDLALASPDQDPLDDPAIADLLDQSGPQGEQARLGLLAKIADAERSERLARLLVALETRSGRSRYATEALAGAAASQQAHELIPQLVSRLVLLGPREAVRSALLSFGRPAMEEVWGTLQDPLRERRLRVQLPYTLARFGTKAAAELLLQCIETEEDGLIRYRAIRGLGRITAEGQVTVDRRRVERLAYANLVEHFRLLGLRAPFSSDPEGETESSTTRFLLVGLLDDKLRQSLERTFRLLKIAHPRDDIHRVQLVAQSKDSRARANAGEFLDALLRRHDQRSLRELILLVADNLSIAERVARAAASLPTAPPATRQQAVSSMLDDADAALVALAELHAGTLAGKSVRVAIRAGLDDRATFELSAVGRVDGLDSPEPVPHA